MANVNETSQLTAHLANGREEIERLERRIQALQDDCNKLQRQLATTEMERDRYRQAFLDQARAAREFENLDIPTLEAISAGPVETIQ